MTRRLDLDLAKFTRIRMLHALYSSSNPAYRGTDKISVDYLSKYGCESQSLVGIYYNYAYEVYEVWTRISVWHFYQGPVQGSHSQQVLALIKEYNNKIIYSSGCFGQTQNCREGDESKSKSQRWRWSEKYQSLSSAIQ